MAWLGIHIEPAAIRAVLTDADGLYHASESVRLATSHPVRGQCEQDPADWWAAMIAAVDALRTRQPDLVSGLRGIAVAGSGRGLVLLDGQDRPLRPAILAGDDRATADWAPLAAELPLGARAGGTPRPDAPGPLLRWLDRNEPGLAARAARVLSPADYLRLRLCGRAVSDMSAASDALWLRPENRAYCGATLSRLGLVPDQLPVLAEGTAPAGALLPELCRRWQLDRPAILAAGASARAASACALGVTRSGDAMVILEADPDLLTLTDRPRTPAGDAAPGLSCHALPGLWQLRGTAPPALCGLTWLAGLTGNTPAELAAMAQGSFSGPGREVFLPDTGDLPTGAGAFVGLSAQTDMPRLVQALLEGAAFALRDRQAAILAAGGQITSLVALGSGARAPLWVEIVATLLDRRICVQGPDVAGPEMGAARLAQLAATEEDPHAVCPRPPAPEVIGPRTVFARAYDRQYDRYRALGRAIPGADADHGTAATGDGGG